VTNTTQSREFTLKFFYITKSSPTQDSRARDFTQFHTPVELPALNRIECTGNKFPRVEETGAASSGKFRKRHAVSARIYGDPQNAQEH
jgi:hypothetical protein